MRIGWSWSEKWAPQTQTNALAHSTPSLSRYKLDLRRHVGCGHLYLCSVSVHWRLSLCRCGPADDLKSDLKSRVATTRFSTQIVSESCIGIFAVNSEVRYGPLTACVACPVSVD